MNTAEYNKICGNIRDMGDKEFSRLFNLIAYERARRLAARDLENETVFDLNISINFKGNMGTMMIWDQHQSLNRLAQ